MRIKHAIDKKLELPAHWFKDGNADDDCDGNDDFVVLS